MIIGEVYDIVCKKKVGEIILASFEGSSFGDFKFSSRPLEVQEMPEGVGEVLNARIVHDLITGETYFIHAYHFWGQSGVFGIRIFRNY